MLPAAALYIVSNADQLYGPPQRIAPAIPAKRRAAEQRLVAQPDVAIRRARPEDARRLRDLAQLDSSRPLHGDALVAEVGGTAIAALALDGGRVVADPFVRTADLVEMLRVHTAGGRSDTARGRRRWLPLPARQPLTPRLA